MGDDETRWLEPAELQTWMTLAALMFKLPGALDVQLQRDSELTHFEYLCLAMLPTSAWIWFRVRKQLAQDIADGMPVGIQPKQDDEATI